MLSEYLNTVLRTQRTANILHKGLDKEAGELVDQFGKPIPPPPPSPIMIPPPEPIVKPNLYKPTVKPISQFGPIDTIGGIAGRVGQKALGIGKDIWSNRSRLVKPAAILLSLYGAYKWYKSGKQEAQKKEAELAESKVLKSLSNKKEE